MRLGFVMGVEITLLVTGETVSYVQQRTKLCEATETTGRAWPGLPKMQCLIFTVQQDAAVTGVSSIRKIPPFLLWRLGACLMRLASGAGARLVC